MQGEDSRGTGLRWRAILETRWQARLQEVTQLSTAYHTVAADSTEGKHARRLLRRTVAARRQLADTEDALRRVTAGTFGRCEQCGEPIHETVLAAAPESRYCGACGASALGVARQAPPAGRSPVTAAARQTG